ncbi:hypothetical protein [Sphingomonas sp. LaA6.9]|uniref:hypothetical protein n=1 Tax=Sphingomonas sp. LaA6.9 TaxID=2919914 RepID=UPI001F4F9A9F|nr:hypothetical protein [Sphingomonas sp. LaA6.9]MCJ8156099.1 hypothetical protein [Sphingomonas sp. LaA6.9]
MRTFRLRVISADMNCTFAFEYEFSRDGDDFGWLMAHVQAPNFSRRNGMWVQWEALVDFSASLARYPIEAEKPIACEWGFSENGKYTAVTKLKVSPEGSTGGLAASVLLANYDKPEDRCQARFQTNYPSLLQFQHEIDRMMREKVGVAILTGRNVTVR